MSDFPALYLIILLFFFSILQNKTVKLNKPELNRKQEVIEDIAMTNNTGIN